MRLENTELPLLQIAFGRLECGAQSEKSTAACPADRMCVSCSSHFSRRAETNVPANPDFARLDPKVTTDDSPYLNNLRVDWVQLNRCFLANSSGERDAPSRRYISISAVSFPHFVSADTVLSTSQSVFSSRKPDFAFHQIWCHPRTHCFIQIPPTNFIKAAKRE